MNKDDRNVFHPKHYNQSKRKECWEEMIDIFGRDAVIIFDCLNAYKYYYRKGLKDGNPCEQDTEKMKNYMDHAEELNERKISYFPVVRETLKTMRSILESEEKE